jgi:hypothetical protein
MVDKQTFLRFLKEQMKAYEVSWLVTDARSFEWNEINSNPSAFIKGIKALKFRKAFMGVFNPQTKQMVYYAFIVEG